MKTIVLDRDGVINQDSDNYIRNVDEWLPIDGSIEAIVALSTAGYTVAIATNQSGLARGYFDEIALANMHQKLCTLVEDAGGKIAGIFYCPHLPSDNCECRKPKPGLLKQIEVELQVTLQNSWFIGDSLSDLSTALNFGCVPVLVRTGKGESTESKILSTADLSKIFSDLPVYTNLSAAVASLLGIKE